jgi:xanthine dehydrogenase YagT iron-sulfur-binding subunit
MPDHDPPEPTPSASRLTRRSFLRNVGLTGLAAAAPNFPRLLSQTADPAPVAPPPMPTTASAKIRVSLAVNGTPRTAEVEPRVVLLDFLREQLGLPGTKKGCDHGQCGACTVLVNGRRILSCLSLVAMHDGDDITTVEGLEEDGELHPVQAAFLECDAFQCGACTSGQIVSAVGLLDEPVGDPDACVREAMSGNICRCGAYKNIVAAVQQARRNA